MIRIFLVVIIFLSLQSSGISQPKKDFVLLGQLYGTSPYQFYEKLRGNIKEFKQLNYWAKEEAGKTVKGNLITTADRRTTPMGKDYFEEYNSSGIIIKHGVLDENGKLLEYWDVDTDSGKILKAYYYTNDILRSEISFRYDGEYLVEEKYLLPGTNQMVKSVSMEYNSEGKVTKHSFFNFRNEPAGHDEYTYNNAGLIESIKVYLNTGTLNIVYNFTYNSEGEKIKQDQENFINGDIRSYKFEYGYDDRGNCIKAIFIMNDKPFIYRERLIKYFD